MTELHEAIINETGIGNIKDYTPKYKFIIPYFDIATWHDYMEENFRSIDALFNYIYEIKQYRGKWKQLTKVNVDDVYFIDDDEDPLNGRLVKVLVEHTTDDTAHFSDYYNAHQSYYEIFDDASAAQVYAQEAKGYRDEAENAKTIAQQSATSSEQYKDLAFIYKEDALDAKNSAQTYSTNAESYKNQANIAKQSAEFSASQAEKAKSELEFCPLIIHDAVLDKTKWISSENDIYISDLFKAAYPFCYSYKVTMEGDVSPSYPTNYTTTGIVTFSVDDVLSGNFAPVARFAMTGYVDDKLNFYFVIYAKEVPQKDITIPTVLIYSKENES